MLSQDNQISINNDTVLSDIQSAFNRLYPFLTIEFFAGKKIALNNKQKNLSTNYQVKDFTLIKNPVTINIAPDRTIKEIEYDFRQLTGLQIEVFRKSGNVWNGISLTDNWTLQSQNMAGQSICEEIESYE